MQKSQKCSINICSLGEKKLNGTLMAYITYEALLNQTVTNHNFKQQLLKFM